VAVGQELGNGVTLRYISLACLKEREFVRRVEVFVIFRLSSLIIICDNLRLLACHFTNDYAHVYQIITSHLRVDLQI